MIKGNEENLCSCSYGTDRNAKNFIVEENEADQFRQQNLSKHLFLNDAQVLASKGKEKIGGRAGSKTRGRL